MVGGGHRDVQKECEWAGKSIGASWYTRLCTRTRGARELLMDGEGGGGGRENERTIERAGRRW